MIKRIASIGLIVLAALPAAAQDIMYQNAGQCPSNYLKFEDVCIRTKFLKEHNTKTVARKLMEFRAKNKPPPGTRGSFSACLSKIEEDKDDVLMLENGAIVEIARGYLGFVGYRKDALLFLDGAGWKIWIKGKRVFPVDMYRKPKSCRAPSVYPIETAVNDEIFIINGEKFAAQTYCLGWSKGESVIFLDGSEYGACASATIFNVDRAESCDVWCV